MADLTPVQRLGTLWAKRDDLFELSPGGPRGAKVRSALRLAEARRAWGLVTACSRDAQLGARVAAVARHLGIPCQVHTAAGATTPPIRACFALGASVIQHSPGYMTVLQKRGRESAEERGWEFVRLGVESPEAVEGTALQVANLPQEVERLVLCVGSGVTLAGVLKGLDRFNRQIPILAVTVGMHPIPTLERCYDRWRGHDIEFMPAGVPFEREVPNELLTELELDLHYESKALPFLRPGDCLWVVSGPGGVL